LPGEEREAEITVLLLSNSNPSRIIITDDLELGHVAGALDE